MLFTACLLPVLALVVWRDIATRTIPDTASILLAVLCAAWRLQAGFEALLVSALCAAALLLLLILPFARGAFGGGDIKLMVALVPGMAPPAILDFLLITAMLGGILALAYLALSYLTLARMMPARRPRPAATRAALPRVLRVESWRIRRGGPLPYGVAIALGSVAALLRAA